MLAVLVCLFPKTVNALIVTAVYSCFPVTQFSNPNTARRKPAMKRRVQELRKIQEHHKHHLSNLKIGMVGINKSPDKLYQEASINVQSIKQKHQTDFQNYVLFKIYVFKIETNDGNLWVQKLNCMLLH